MVLMNVSESRHGRVGSVYPSDEPLKRMKLSTVGNRSSDERAVIVFVQSRYGKDFSSQRPEGIGTGRQTSRLQLQGSICFILRNE